MHASQYQTETLRAGAGRKLLLRQGKGVFAGVLLFLIAGAWLDARGQAPPVFVPKQLSARSSSGQFVATSRPVLNSAPRVLNVATNEGFLRLEPGLLSVSAERLKQNLWRELEVQGAWQGKVFLSIRRVGSTNDPVLLSSEKFKDGWRYSIDFPEVVETRRYIRALTRCVLLEMANRGSERCAELPPWLVEGLVSHLLVSYPTEILLSRSTPGRNEPGLASSMVNLRREHPLREAQLRLGTNHTFSFQQLSWPTPEDLENHSTYALNAQVFVSELMQLRGGRAALRDSLFNLPRYYNWQFAFLQAFQPWFKRPLDVEKWWELNLTHVTGRNQGETWPVTETWERLDEILSATVEVRSKPDELPQTARVSIQDVLREWERAQRLPILREKLAQLDLLAVRSAPEFRVIISDYRQLLQDYLQKFAKLKPEDYSKNPSSDARAASTAIQALAQLESRRQALQSLSAAQSASATGLPQP